MRDNRRPVVLLAGLLLAGLVVSFWPDSGPEDMSAIVGAMPVTADQPSASTVSAMQGSPSSPPKALPATAPVVDMTNSVEAPQSTRDVPPDRNQLFRQRVRGLLENANQLSAAQRRAEAEYLEGEIQRFENDAELLPVQATLLRTMLLQVTTDSPQAYEEQVNVLARETREKAEAHRVQVQQQLLEANAEYREREMAIVAEVMANDELAADPARRQSELRSRLQALRIELYRKPAP